jgi:arginine/lysine/ornithine decarboxylase
MAERAPLYSALLRLAEQKSLRMHMPGHKGKCPAFLDGADLFALDMTELDATGNLYEGLPPISDAERLMAGAAGASQCFFLAGGATQGLMAAIAAACPPGSRVLVDRGCHRAVFSSMVHLDLRPEYIFPKHLEPWDIAAPVTPAAVEQALRAAPDVSAVILTSPTYYGVLSDISAIAKLTAAHQIPLLVDEAHGAHLPFLNGYQSAAAQGAPLSVASAHKTLPALTAGAFLYADDTWDARELRRYSALFGTSSPSYLVRASMDLSRA